MREYNNTIELIASSVAMNPFFINFCPMSYLKNIAYMHKGIKKTGNRNRFLILSNIMRHTFNRLKKGTVVLHRVLKF